MRIDFSFFEATADAIKDLRILVVGDNCRDVYYETEPGRVIPGSTRAIDVISGDCREEYGMGWFVKSQVSAMGAKVGFVTSGESRIERYSDIVVRRCVKPPREDLVIDGISLFARNERVDAVIVADYNRGAVTPKVMEKINGIGAKCVFVDPGRGKSDSFYDIQNFLLAKRNYSERIGGGSMAKYSIVTRGAFGMWLTGPDGKSHIPALDCEAVDSTGCGDVCIATLCCCYMAGASMYEACWAASVAAGIKVQHAGCRPTSWQEIAEVFSRWHSEA